MFMPYTFRILCGTFVGSAHVFALCVLLLWRHLWRSLFGCRLVAHSQYAMCVEHVCMCEVLIWCCSALGFVGCLVVDWQHCTYVDLSRHAPLSLCSVSARPVDGRYDRDWSPRCDPWLVMFSARGFWMSCFWKPWWILIECMWDTVVSPQLYYTQRKRKTSQFVLNRKIYERMHILITEEVKLTDESV